MEIVIGFVIGAAGAWLVCKYVLECCNKDSSCDKDLPT